MTALRDRLIDGLLTIPHSKLNGDRTKRLPGNVNFCFKGIEGESLLLMLDMKGISSIFRFCMYIRFLRSVSCTSCNRTAARSSTRFPSFIPV